MDTLNINNTNHLEIYLDTNPYIYLVENWICDIDYENKLVVLKQFIGKQEDTCIVYSGFYIKGEIFKTSIASNENKSEDYMFCKKRNIKKIIFKMGIDMTKTYSLHKMFYHCDNLEEIEFGDLNTKNTTDFSCMFYGCGKLNHLNLLDFDTKNGICFDEMFCGCESLNTLNLSNFFTPNLISVNAMFLRCINLKYLNISNLNTTTIQSAYHWFFDCNQLETLIVNKDTFKIDKFKVQEIFKYCDNLKEIKYSK